MHFIAGYETEIYRPKLEKRLVNRIGIAIIAFGVETFIFMVLHLSVTLALLVVDQIER